MEGSYDSGLQDIQMQVVHDGEAGHIQGLAQGPMETYEPQQQTFWKLPTQTKIPQIPTKRTTQH